MFLLKTPGGGGYGPVDDEGHGEIQSKKRKLETNTEKSNLPSSHVGRGSVFDYKRAQESA